MRLIGLMGGLAGLFADALRFTGWQQPNYQRRYGSKSTYRAPFRRGPRPDAPRWWHDQEQPGQCARLQAAKDKRSEKAKKLDTWAFLSADNNRAHVDQFDNLHERLNPFYVAK